MARKGDKSQFWSHEFIWNSQTFWIQRLKSSRPPWKFQRWDLDRLKKESHQDFFFQCSNPMKINPIFKLIKTRSAFKIVMTHDNVVRRWIERRNLISDWLNISYNLRTHVTWPILRLGSQALAIPFVEQSLFASIITRSAIAL